MPKAKNPRSERAMREAVKLVSLGKAEIIHGDVQDFQVLAVTADDVSSVIAVFDIRDCYRKRAPLKGINKKLARVVRGVK